MNKRSSNMELLRIFAMLIIIAYHIFCHCVKIQLTDVQTMLDKGNGWFCSPGFSKRLIILALISPMGQIGNAVFIIISGYFMVHKGNDINLTKISKKLLLQLGFATIVLAIVSVIAYNKITEISVQLINFNSFNNSSWFVGYYFIVIILAKIFLNNFLLKLKKEEYTMFLFVMFAIVQFGWSKTVIANFAEGLEMVCIGIFLYALGGYIKKYDPFEKIRTWVIFAVIIGINLLICDNYYAMTANKILAFDSQSGDTFIQSIPGYANYYFIPVALGIAIFELFRRMNIPNSKLINYLGASTFMVYLLHDNSFFYSLWDIQDWITLLHENVVQFVKAYTFWILGTFAAGVIIYTIFILGGKLLEFCKPLVIKKGMCE